MTYHYTYIIVNIENNMKYIGARSCKHHPTQDVRYMSSSENVKAEIKRLGISAFRKDILAIWSSRNEAIAHEILLHDCFDVAINHQFYNKSKQTSTKFDTTGCTWKLSESTKIKQGVWQKGKPKTYTVWNKGKTGLQQMSEEEKQKRSIKYSGKNNPMYGKSAAKDLNLKWYNNGEKSIFVPEGTQPDGYARGRKHIHWQR